MRPLPPGRHFAVTWGIPDDYGGMTTAMLQRSRAFVRLGGATVDVLTFDARPDYPEVERRLRAAGELVDGMRLLNLYDWLRQNPLLGGSLRLELHPFTPLGPAEPGLLTRTRTADDGTVLQVDHFRRDGSLLLSDRRDVQQPGVLGGRSVVLCDEAGRPVRSWGRIHHLYAAWLDRLTRKKPSFMIADSKTIARFLLNYRRPHVTTVHVVHNSHLGADGGFRESRRDVFERLEDFDSVVLLTDRQRRDVRAVLGPVPHLSVIPNAAPEVEAGALDRDPRRGVVLASLTARKRVDHAMRAAASVEGVTVDIYGDGELRPRLEKLATASVVLRGYRPDARRELETASFLLATGSSEGLPLVLIEAMAAGCIPIAYDVPYGPSDMIDGTNGILVPSGDEAALAAAIRTLSTESPAALARRRRHARRTAQRYTDAAITAQWRRELRAAARRHARALAAPAARVGETASRRAS
ncbi:MAG: glycosyltransferase [Pseudolysinimonas sp.]